jgi:hypothetical protein
VLIKLAINCFPCYPYQLLLILLMQTFAFVFYL